MPRPSRQQRLTDAEAAARRKNLAAIQAQQRMAARQARDKRRYALGTLVDEAGLADLDDVVLRPLLGLLATIASAPNPVAVLGALLCDADDGPGMGVDGFAHAAHDVSAAH